MLRIALCDDDPAVFGWVREKLTAFSILHNREFSLQFFSSAGELLNAPADYSILILDIALDNGIDGIEIGKELRRQGNNAVFLLLTATADRAYDGYAANVLRYLVKIPPQKEFDEAVLAAIDLFEQDRRVLLVHYSQSTDYVPHKDILYIKSSRRKRFVHTSYRVFPTTASMRSLTGALKDDPAFFQVQTSYCINLKHVRHSSKKQVEMNDGQVVRFPRGKYEEFDRRYFAYLDSPL